MSNESLVACSACSCHVEAAACVCPHCGERLRRCGTSHLRAAGALIMGLAAAGCNGVGDDIGVQPEYGVAETGYLDGDGDGFTPMEGDCDDSDADRFPGAEETADDGIDSNCDGNDNT